MPKNPGGKKVKYPKVTKPRKQVLKKKGRKK